MYHFSGRLTFAQGLDNKEGTFTSRDNTADTFKCDKGHIVRGSVATAQEDFVVAAPTCKATAAMLSPLLGPSSWSHLPPPRVSVSSVSGCPETQNSFQFILHDKAALCLAAWGGGKPTSLLRRPSKGFSCKQTERMSCSLESADEGSATITSPNTYRDLRVGSRDEGLQRAVAVWPQLCNSTGHSSVPKPWGWCAQAGG